MSRRHALIYSLIIGALVMIGSLAMSGSCDGRSGIDRTIVKIRSARNLLNAPAARIILPERRRLIDINYACAVQEPHCLTVLTRVLRDDESPLTYELAIPYAWGKIPRVITIVEQRENQSSTIE